MSGDLWNVLHEHIGKEVDLTLNISGEGRFARGVISNILTDVVQLDSYRPTYFIIGKEKLKRTRYSKTYYKISEIVGVSYHTYDDVEKII